MSIASIFCFGFALFSVSAENVYAQSLWDVVPIEEVTLISDNDAELKPTDSVNLNVQTMPEYAIQTASNIEYQIVQGSYFASIFGTVLTVNEDATIGEKIIVRAVVDGIASSNDITWIVAKIPVESISILNTQTQINQNESLQLTTEILPLNASYKNVIYTMVQGAQYATVNSDGVLRVRDNLPTGDLKVKVRAISVSDSTMTADREFSLYVPTRSLGLSVNHLQPIPGQILNLIPQSTASATGLIPEYQIVSGAEFVEYIQGNTIKIKENISDFNPQIVLNCSRDGYTSNNVQLNIYVPTTELSITASKTIIKQGEMLQLSVSVNPENATLTSLKYYIEESTYATLTERGLLQAKTNTGAQLASVFVYAVLDGITSEQVEIIIEKPNVILTADNFNPTSSSVVADSLLLTAIKDGVEQENAQYNILSGGEFIESLVNGVLQVKTGISVYNPQIKLTALCGEFESAEIIIDIKILAEDILIENTTAEAEQQESCDFSGQILPLNATLAGEQLAYEINVGTEVASISSQGVLSIFKTAPIGTQITITITGPDGIIKTHTVMVKTVYATQMRVNDTDNQEVKAEDIISFDVDFPTPFNITESVKVYNLSLLEGDIQVATVSEDGQYIIIKSLEEIALTEIYKPTFKVQISSNQNGTILREYRTFNLYIPITGVEVVYNESCAETFVQDDKVYVYENEMYNLSNLVRTQITPMNSDVRAISWALWVKGVEYSDNCSYAQIIENNLKIKDRNSIENGNCEITLKASAEGYSATITFAIYIKAKTLSMEVKNLSDSDYVYSPMSTKEYGQSVQISTKVDAKSTNPTALTFEFEKDENGREIGSDLIENFEAQNGILTFSIRKIGDIQSSDRIIKIKAIHKDGVEAYLSEVIVVYVPVQDITLTNESGTMLLHRNHSNPLNLSLKSDIYTITTNIGSVDLSNRSKPILNIPSDTTALTRVEITVETNDSRYSFSKDFVFTVDQLDKSLFKYVRNGSQISSFPYYKDSAGVLIDQNNPQLWVGRQIIVEPTYNGVDLSDLGVSFDFNGWGIRHVAMLCGANPTSRTSTPYFFKRISVPEYVSGTDVFTPTITIYDGDSEYILILPSIKCFRPMSGVPILTNGVINKQTTQLTLSPDGSNWDSRATYRLSDLQFYASETTGVSITASGELTVTSDTASAVQEIVLRCTQKYNGTDVPYIDENGTEYTVQPSLRRLKVKNASSSALSDILAVDGFNEKIIIPTKTGYIFGGCFTDSNGTGKEYFDEKGDLRVVHSDYSNSFELYAKWTAITYNYKVRVYVNDKYKEKYDVSGTVDYDKSFSVEVKGGDFKHFLINGEKNKVKNTKFSKLTSVDGDTVVIYLYVTKESCVASGTLITLADGTQKAVEDLDGSEMLLVWNLETGQFDAAPILFVDVHGEMIYDIIHLYFSDGTDVKVIYEHGFWDFDLNKYVYLDEQNADEYIGHWFNKQYTEPNGELAYKRVQLISVAYEQEFTNSWSPVTFKHLCYYVNDLLSVPASTEDFVNFFEVDSLTMRYNQELLSADIEKYGLFTYADFEHLIPAEIYYAFNGAYMKVAIGKGITSLEGLMKLIETYAKFF